MQIAKGLHRIGSDLVNSYLVIDGDGVTIIDAGLPRYWKLLDRELAREVLQSGARGYVTTGAAQRRLREAYFVAIVTPAIKQLKKMLADMKH